VRSTARIPTLLRRGLSSWAGRRRNPQGRRGRSRRRRAMTARKASWMRLTQCDSRGVDSAGRSARGPPPTSSLRDLLWALRGHIGLDSTPTCWPRRAARRGSGSGPGRVSAAAAHASKNSAGIVPIRPPTARSKMRSMVAALVRQPLALSPSSAQAAPHRGGVRRRYSAGSAARIQRAEFARSSCATG